MSVCVAEATVDKGVAAHFNGSILRGQLTATINVGTKMHCA